MEDNRDWSDDEDVGMCQGGEVQGDFFSNPYIHDPVLEEGDVVAFDVQGSQGNSLQQCCGTKSWMNFFRLSDPVPVFDYPMKFSMLFSEFKVGYLYKICLVLNTLINPRATRKSYV
jgi:hypothetical protein